MSSAVRVNQPAVSKLGAEGDGVGDPRVTAGRRGKPKIPQNAAGTRIEPPVSVPIANGTMSAATAAAEPLLEPPEVRPGKPGMLAVPVVCVLARQAPCELEKLGLAGKDRARRAQVADDPRILPRRRPHLGKEGRAGARRHPGDVKKVLQEVRDPAEGAVGGAGECPPRGRPRPGPPRPRPGAAVRPGGPPAPAEIHGRRPRARAAAILQRSRDVDPCQFAANRKPRPRRPLPRPRAPKWARPGVMPSMLDLSNSCLDWGSNPRMAPPPARKP